MADIFTEVDEEVRKDKFLELWKKYGILAVIAAVIVIGGTAATVGWREYKARQAREQGAIFLAILDQIAAGKYDAADKALTDFLPQASSGYKGPALMRVAQIRLAQGKRAEALNTLKTLAADEDADRPFRDMANYYIAMLDMETGDSAALRARLEGLNGETSPWRHIAREMLAVLAIRDGDKNTARTLLEGLSEDATAPAPVKARAQELLDSLGADAAGSGN